MTTEKKKVYKCDVCGNIVELLVDGEGTLVCCEQDMKALKDNTVDAGKEKHVPVIAKVDGGVQVKIGDIPHPMEEDHWIEMIEIITKKGIIHRKYLNPGDAPEAVFMLSKADVETVRELCNKHGLWIAQA